MNNDFHEDQTSDDIASSNQDTLVTEVQDEDRSHSPSAVFELVPVETEDVERMRLKAIEIRRLRKKEIDLAPVLEQGKDRETELTDMVLTLINSLQPAREQLLAQAETISRLSQQLNFLVTRSTEERESWQAEREGWDRTAETLITQAAKSGPNIYKEYDSGRHVAAAESDNQIIKQKYLEAQNRLTALEAELAQLKPLLLMRPFALTHSHLPLVAASKTKKKLKESEEDLVEISEELSIPEDGPSTPKASKARGQYYRKREEILPTRSPFFGSSKKQHGGSKTVNASGGIPIPVLSDARSEHLLLAARRIGRERASLLSSMVYQSSEVKTPSTLKGKEKAEDDITSPHSSLVPSSVRRPATPKTPRQTSTSMPYTSGGTVTPNVSPSRYPSDSDLGSARVSYPYMHGSRGSNPPQATGSPTRKGRPPGSSKASSSKLSLPSSNTTTHTEYGSQFINWQSQTQSNTPTLSTSRGNQYSSAKQLVMPASPTPTSSKRSSALLTPLESLYSAARSVLSPMTSLEGRPPDLEELSSPLQHKAGVIMKGPDKRRGRAANDPFVIENEELLLPKAKRRRTETVETTLPQSSQLQRQNARGSRERTLSALDVLADQAMVFSTSGSSSHNGPSMPSPLRSTHTLDSEVEDSGRGFNHEDDRIGTISALPRHDRNGWSEESSQRVEKGKAREVLEEDKIDETGQKDVSREEGMPMKSVTSYLNKPLSSSEPASIESENATQRSDTPTPSSDLIAPPGPPTRLNETDLAQLPGLGAQSTGNDQDKTLVLHPSAPASPPPGKSNTAEDVRLRWLQKLGM